MRIARYFTSDELLVSRNHPGLVPRLVELPPAHIINLCRIVHEVLMPLRQRFGPIVVTSGYRTRQLNEAVNGSADSRHLAGCAVDFITQSHPPEAAWDAIQGGDPKATWDRLAWYPVGRFHADIAEDGSEGRGLLFRAESGGWRELP